MSKTDATRPYLLQKVDPTYGRYTVHEHVTGPCDYAPGNGLENFQRYTNYKTGIVKQYRCYDAVGSGQDRRLIHHSDNNRIWQRIEMRQERARTHSLLHQATSDGMTCDPDIPAHGKTYRSGYKWFQ